jgi:hypothetical protein
MPKKKLTNSCIPHRAFKHSHHPERNTAIVKARLAGKSYAAIGREYGLSGHRIHQIVGRYQRYERYAAEAEAEAALTDGERAAREKRRKDEEEASLRERDRRYYEQELLRATQLIAEQSNFFDSLAGSPSMEDAILHVQKTLGCDRETARLKIREAFI